MENVDKIDSNYNNESHINRKFLNIDVEDDSIKTYYGNTSLENIMRFIVPLKKFWKVLMMHQIHFDSTFEAMSESLEKRK